MPQALGEITLREYVDLRWDEWDKRIALLVAANAERIAGIYERLAVMNEVRAQLNDQARTFARGDRVDADLRALREYIDQRINALETLARTLAEANEKLENTHWEENRKRIQALELFQANIQGRIAAYSGLTFLAAIVVSIVLHFWH